MRPEYPYFGQHSDGAALWVPVILLSIVVLNGIYMALTGKLKEK